jgi:hypothetical protein
MNKKVFKKNKAVKKILKNNWKKRWVRIIVFVIIFLAFVFIANFLIDSALKTMALKKARMEEYANNLNHIQNVYVLYDENKETENDEEFEGIGIEFSIKSDIVFVSGIINDSPAEKAGLKVGDKIFKIDGEYARGMYAKHVTERLMGEKGTKVVLEIYRDSFGDEIKEFVITRDLIKKSEKDPNHEAFMKEGKGGEDLGNNYWRYRGKIYYWSAGPHAAPGMFSVMADSDTFVSIDNPYCDWDKSDIKFDPCRRYGKDDETVFINGYKLKEADPKTFEIVEEWFSKDRERVYYGSQEIKEIDPETFEMIGSGEYVKDNDSIAYASRGNVVTEANMETFEVMFDGYAKDKNNVYVYGRAMKDVDSNTFQIVYERHCGIARNIASKDNDSYFWNGVKVDKITFDEKIAKTKGLKCGE